MERIYAYTKLTRDNKANSLDTLFLLTTLDTKFTLSDINTFYREHSLRDEAILINSTPTLSLTEVLRTNDALINSLNLKVKIIDLFSLMTSDLNSLSFNEIKTFVLNNKEEVSYYLHTQGILNSTMNVCSIILHQNNILIKYNTPKNLSFNSDESVFNYFCEECLIKYSSFNNNFRYFYFNYCIKINNINFIKLVKDEFISYTYFINNTFEEYYNFINNKIIIKEDVNDIISLFYDKNYKFKNELKYNTLTHKENISYKKIENNNKINNLNDKETNNLNDNIIYNELTDTISDNLSIDSLLTDRLSSTSYTEDIPSFNDTSIHISLIESEVNDIIINNRISLLNILIEKESDYLMLTNKEFLILFKNNNYFLNKYIKYYIINDIMINGKEEYFKTYKYIHNTLNNQNNNNDKLLLLNNYDWLNDNEMNTLINLYLQWYSSDDLFDLIYNHNINLLISFSNPLYNLLYNCKFNNKINKEDIINLSDKNINKLIKECYSADQFIDYLNYNDLSQHNISLLIKKVSNPIDLVRILINNKVKIRFYPELMSYDPSFILPIALEILNNNCTIKVCKEILNYLIKNVLVDDFFVEDNLEIIKEIIEKVINIQDISLERMKN
ncbi:hypothetical protein H311_02897, partial [Anncaliia algerae PRA109]